jgi:GxxExxY protein
MITTETPSHGEVQELEVEDHLTRQIIGAAIEVHRALGPGLLESAYEECLCLELKLRGLSFRRQVAIPIEYKGIKLDCAYAADLIVNDQVILELKAVEKILAIHEAQLLTYMKLLKMKKGLLINFNTAVLKHGIRRRVL